MIEGPQVVESADSSLRLSAQEKRVALQIKAAVEGRPDLEPLSDFMCAHFAIVSLLDSRSMEVTMEKIAGLQNLKKEYGVLDTYSHSKQTTSRCVLEVMPGTNLAFGLCSGESGSYWRAMDATTYDASGILANEEKIKIWMGGECYIHQALFPTFDAMRHGCIVLNECGGYDWKDPKMLNMAALKKFRDFMYPWHFRLSMQHNTGVFAKHIYNILKPVLSVLDMESYEFGCECGGSRLDEIFLVPDLETASLNFLVELDKSLKIRYKNETSFSLTDPSPQFE